MLGAMTVLMFAIATLHFASVNETTFREFFADQMPSCSRAGVSSQFQSFVTEFINVCCHFVVSAVC